MLISRSQLGIALTFFFFLSQQKSLTARDTPVQVGIYQNPPKVFVDDQGRPSGFFSDLTQVIAEEEGWTLDFVACEWAECLDAVENEELDLMVDVSYSPERDQRFDFNREVVFPSWSVVYARKGVEFHSILDLDNKRIGVLEDGIQHDALVQTAKDFGIHPQFVGVSDYFELVELLESGQLDGGVFNRFFATQIQSRQIIRTNLLVKPAQVHFIVPEGKNVDLLNAIDRHLATMKNQPNSEYYKAGEQWLGGLDIQSTNWRTVRQMAVGGVAILGIGFVTSIVLWNDILRREIADRILAQERLKHEAFHDSLTRLPNRNYLNRRLSLTLEKLQCTEIKSLVVLFLDLDQFKVVNDSLGHLAGDELLVEVAGRIQVTLQTQLSNYRTFTARLGGDEFVILIEEKDSLEEITSALQGLFQTLKKPFFLKGQEIFISASVGVVFGNLAYKNASELMRDADIALYQAKSQGRACYKVFTPAMGTQASQRLSLENDLRKALLSREFTLYFQPIVNLQGQHTIVGVEALARWQHPQKGLLSPGLFIPVAEETGLILPLGWWVLEEACWHIRAWTSQFPEFSKLTISVNVSALQLREPDFLARLDHILEKTGTRGENLVLEITESLLIENCGVVYELLKCLQERSVGISIDDFGTGYSSLSYLHQLPITTLKVDKLFINHLLDNPKQQRIVETLLLLADNIGLKSIAEGIELPEQITFLKKHGCEYGQGYLFDKPLPATALVQRLRQNARRSA